MISFIWAPTFTHRSGAFYKYVVNNWQLGSITSLASGHVAGSESVRLSNSAIAGALSAVTGCMLMRTVKAKLAEQE